MEIAVDKSFGQSHLILASNYLEESSALLEAAVPLDEFDQDKNPVSGSVPELD